MAPGSGAENLELMTPKGAVPEDGALGTPGWPEKSRDAPCGFKLRLQEKAARESLVAAATRLLAKWSFRRELIGCRFS